MNITKYLTGVEYDYEHANNRTYINTILCAHDSPSSDDFINALIDVIDTDRNCYVLKVTYPESYSRIFDELSNYKTLEGLSFFNPNEHASNLICLIKGFCEYKSIYFPPTLPINLNVDIEWMHSDKPDLLDEYDIKNLLRLHFNNRECFISKEKAPIFCNKDHK